MLKLLDKALGRRRIVDLDRTVQDQKKQIIWLERLVTELLVEQRGHCLMPPPRLRMHVGARDSAANFWNQGRQSAARVIEVFGTDPDGPVLDWGCGSGRTLYWLHAHEAWRRSYRGCDVDEEAITWLRKQQRIKAVAVCQDDPPLPCEDAQFAGLFCFSVLTHIHPLKHAGWYREIHRVLKPGGRAYLTVNGDGRAADALSFTAPEREAFGRQGWLWAERDGHYKDAAVVGRAFTLKALEGLFEVEQYRPFGYHNMDDLIVRRL